MRASCLWTRAWRPKQLGAEFVGVLLVKLSESLLPRPHNPFVFVRSKSEYKEFDSNSSGLVRGTSKPNGPGKWGKLQLAYF